MGTSPSVERELFFGNTKIIMSRCDLAFIAAALAIAIGGCMGVYSRISPEPAYAKAPPASAAPPVAIPAAANTQV